MPVKKIEKKSFVSKVNASKPIYIYSSFDKNKNPFWFIIRSDAKRIAKLKKTTSNETINIKDYGEVLTAGIGTSPDKKTLEQYS